MKAAYKTIILMVIALGMAFTSNAQAGSVLNLNTDNFSLRGDSSTNGIVIIETRTRRR